ncbi:MAG: hypothetical protein FJ098_09335 [Deltaproteobacteria bacterium]|nr:hypothetical protein [Deltaproteobacteria bacterium]
MRRFLVLVAVCALATSCGAEQAKETAKDKGGAEQAVTAPAPATATEPAPATATEPAPATPGSPPAAETAPATEPSKPPSADAREILRELAPRLPASTVIFGFLDPSVLGPGELGMGLISLPESFDLAAMNAELGAFLKKRIGLDPLHATWLAAAVAVEPDFAALFLGGDFGPLEGGLDLPGGIVARTLEGEEGITLATLPGGKGLAVLFHGDHVTTLSRVAAGEAPALAGSPGLALFETVLAAAGPRHLVLAGQLSDAALRQKAFDGMEKSVKGFVPPDAALLAAGGGKVLALVHGDDAALGMIEGQLSLAKAMARGLIDKGMAGIDEAPVGAGLGLITAKHLWPVISEQLMPKREGDFLRLELTITGSALGVVTITGILSAIAIPAFMKYTRKARAMEAEQALDAIHRDAVGHAAEAPPAPPPDAAPPVAAP